jgi:hypothetical protein
MESMDHERWLHRIESALLALKKDIAISPLSSESAGPSNLHRTQGAAGKLTRARSSRGRRT